MSSIRMFNIYISNISSSISWGGDGGSCQMTLVEDVNNNINIRQPSVGTPVYINAGSFYFGGILQRMTYKESISGRTYDVTIESAAKLLDGIQVIVGGFNGVNYSGNGAVFTTQIPNIYNVFAEYENYSYGGIFGAAEVNSVGMPAHKVLSKIQALSNNNGTFGSKAKFGSHQYSIDLSELISKFNNVNYRIKGPVQSLASIIQECCDVAGLDYFVQLKGTKGSYNVLTNPIIKIQTIERGYQPNLGIIKSFIDRAKNSGTLVSSEHGNEWANTTAQKLVIGGPASRFTVEFTSNAFPVWGKLANNQYVVDNRPASLAYGLINSPLPIALDEYSTNLNYIASTFELRMALGGKDCWETFKSFQTIFGVEPNGRNDPLTAPWAGSIESNIDIFSRIFSGKATSIDLQSTSYIYAYKRAKELKDKSGTFMPFEVELTKLADIIYSAVSRVATNYYGQVFLMPLSNYEPGGINNNLRFLPDEVQYQTQWEIADSAYTDAKPFADLTFYDGEGKLRGGAAWPVSTSYDYSALGGDWDFSPFGGVATNKGGPDKDIYWVNGQPCVIVRSGGQVLNYDILTTPDFGLSYLYYLFTNVLIPPGSYLTSGAQNVQISIPPAVVPPSSFGIPLQSTTYSWGPWYVWSGGSPSKSEVVVDESLKPETFGSSELLDEAGFATAMSGLSSVGINETGTVEVTGDAEFNIGDRFDSLGPYITGIDLNIGVDGEKVTYKFSTWTPSFGKMSKTNIDRIANIYKGSLALSQRTRSQIQKRPLPKIKFEKSDLSALSQKYTQPSPNMIHSFINSLI